MPSLRIRRSGGSGEKAPLSRSISRGSSWASRPGCVAGFFAVFLLAGLGFLSFFAVAAWKVIEARSWVEVPCRVLESEVESHSDSDGTTYSVRIVYRYSVDGVEHTSDRYKFLGGSSSGYSGKAEVVARYPPGSRAVCWVDPDDPAEAVFDRGLSAEFLFALLPLVFVAIGGGGMVWALSGGSFRRRAKPVGWLPDAPTGEREPPAVAAAAFSRGPASGLPAAGAAGPLVLEARHGPWLKLLLAVFIATFWNGITGVFVWQAVKGWQEGGNADTGCLTLFLVPFVLVGLGLLAAVPYQVLALFNPRVRLEISSASIPLGGTAQLRWHFTGASGRISRLRIDLVGSEAATYRRGTTTTTDTEVFALVPVVDTTQSMEIAGGGATLSVPDATMHSFEAPNNKIRWFLKVAGEIRRWPDVAEQFDVVVEPHGAVGRTTW